MRLTLTISEREKKRKTSRLGPRAPCPPVLRFHPVMVAVLVAAKVPKGRSCSSQQDCAGTATTTCVLDKTSGKKHCLCRDGNPPVNSKCAVIPTGRLSRLQVATAQSRI